MLTSKKDYLNYLDSLEKVELAKEYENIYCFYEHLKYHYDLFKSYIYVNVINKTKEAFLSKKTVDYKKILKDTLNHLNRYNNKTIKEFLYNCNQYEVEEYPLEDINKEMIIELYDKIIDLEETNYPTGKYNQIKMLSNLIENNVIIYKHFVFNNKFILNDFVNFPEVLVGKKDGNGNWDYKETLYRLMYNMISWFEYIEG